MIAIFIILSHVPTYENCVDNCCALTKDHKISQVNYFKNTGGIEIDLTYTNPFEKHEIIDIDITFKEKYDTSQFHVYVGCGGCATEDPIVEPPSDIVYQTGEVEPFTQTKYYSGFQTLQKKFNTSLLEECVENHFTIRLINNGSNDIVWGAVVGLEESFTASELVNFPRYILKNHGKTWNDLEYTYFTWLFVGVPTLLLIYTPRWRLELTFLNAMYLIAITGFLSAALEEFTHLLYAQQDIPLSYQFWVGFFIVIVLANGLGLIAIRTFWKRQSILWSLLEIQIGIALLFVLGSGFYVGPLSLVSAGVSKLGVALYKVYDKRQSVQTNFTDCNVVSIRQDSGKIIGRNFNKESHNRDYLPKRVRVHNV